MKYVSPAYCDILQKEFLSLRQRDMSIVDYEQKFGRLSHIMLEVLLKRKRTNIGNSKMI